MRLLLLDNYDSFVHNLGQYLGELGAEVSVVRNDALDLRGLERLDPDAIVISPGPGHPANPRDFGVCAEVLTTMSKHVPTLGVCLGHQGFAHAYGGKVRHAGTVMHGKASPIHHDGRTIFAGLESPLIAGRYHSLIVDAHLPPELEVSATTAEGEVMAMRHRHYPIEGVQFHPESVLTPQGKNVLANFLRMSQR
jgi:anthranilate synthase/aminodeoxychorismate synthase-like glutamine amidotransferase